MKKEWFEPGPDGKSPFERLSATVGFGAAGTAAAFRALLAEDAQPAPVELRVGDVVRLERYKDGTDGVGWSDDDVGDVGMVLPVTALVARVGRTCWPISALTLIRRAGEEQHDERDAMIAHLRAEVELAKEDRDNQYRVADRLRIMNNDLEATCAHLLSERDALQARIDAGVRVWGDHLVWGQLEEHDTHTGIVIDVEKIRPDVVEMADERTTPGTRADRRAS